MRRINQLSSYVYNRIAAGEVVERPASVVKELVENSIDAGASDISVYIFGGGSEKISVIDNGGGIHNEDFNLAFLPHATSKISLATDLDNICTLGFRGEALASIASVSKVNIKSRITDSEIAYTADFDGEKITKVTPCSGNVGTQMTVASLFYNTPARARFMKKPRSEEQAITLLMTKLMLANSFVRFNYYSENKLLLTSSGKGLESVIKSIYPKEIYTEILDIDVKIGDCHLTGFILPNTVTRHNKHTQTLTVNGRIILNANIAAAINKAYGERLFTGQHPVYFLNLIIKTDDLDINVTPSKTDARFFNPDNLFSLFYHTVKNRLAKFEEDKMLKIYNDLSNKADDVAATVTSTATASDALTADYNLESNAFADLKREYFSDTNSSQNSSDEAITKAGVDYSAIGDISALKSIYAETSRGLSEGSKLLEIIAKKPPEQSTTTNMSIEDIETTGETRKNILASGINVIGVCFNTYLLVDANSKLYFVDIHAANERILYDKLMLQISMDNISVQPLLIPDIINLDYDDFNYIQKLFNSLNEFGFEIDDFGGNSVKISAVPQILTDINVKDFIAELIQNKNTCLSMSNIIREKLSLYACKNSIKAGTGLTSEQAKIMAEKIFCSGAIPLTCPHGRPIIIEMTKAEIERKFRR